MIRFVDLNGYCVNVTHIKQFYKEYPNGDLVVEMNDGSIRRVSKKYSGYTEDEIRGYSHIIQIIPVKNRTTAIFKDFDGKEYENDILYLALTASGLVRPLDCLGGYYDFVDDVGNFKCLCEKESGGWKLIEEGDQDEQK